ncbi:beta/gamma crystallin domain-containing protein, partial [Nonomuraea candida]|uniref:beta/gamma crystallin domain-containing protein n=1 Tax=Nonomuraea candida TaxID=359159 RepID=UPI001B80518F
LIIPAAPALAINVVPCGPEFLQVNWHNTTHLGGVSHHVTCFANGGEYDITGWRVGDKQWLDRISTGNNRVQWYGDGRWQPEGGINKWSVYTFPNNPGGVHLDKIRII